jgi:hypothetical protein
MIQHTKGSSSSKFKIRIIYNYRFLLIFINIISMFSVQPAKNRMQMHFIQHPDLQFYVYIVEIKCSIVSSNCHFSKVSLACGCYM